MKKSNVSNLPPCPAHLSPEAAAWWDKINSGWTLDDPGLLLLESALESFDRMRQAQKILKKEGQVVRDRFGQPKAHPATLTERDSKTTMLRIFKGLNLDLEPLNPGPGRPAGKKEK